MRNRFILTAVVFVAVVTLVYPCQAPPPQSEARVEVQHGPWSALGVETVEPVPGTNLVVTGGRLVQVWDTSRGDTIFTIHEPSSVVALSPDGRYLAVGLTTSLPEITFFDLTTGKLAFRFSLAPVAQELAQRRGGLFNRIHRIRFSSDGKYLLSASFAHAFQVWEFPAGKLLRNTQVENAGALDLSFALSPDDKLVALTDGTTLRVLSFPSCAPVALLAEHKKQVRYVAFLPDSANLLSASQTTADDRVLLWDVRQGTHRVLAVRTSEMQRAALSPTGEYLAVGQKYGGAVELWRLDGTGPAETIDGNYDCFSFARDGKELAVVSHLSGDSSDDKVGFLALLQVPGGQTLKKLRFAPLSPIQGRVTVSRDGAALAWVDYDDSMRLLRFTPLRVEKHLMFTKRQNASAGSRRISDLSFTREGRYLAAVEQYCFGANSGCYNSTLRVLDLEGGSVWEVPGARGFASLSQNHLAVCPTDPETPITIWDLSTKQKVASLKPGIAVSASSDGRLLAYCGNDGIALYEHQSGAALRTLAMVGKYRTLEYFGFSPDDAYLVLADYESPAEFVRVNPSVLMWRAATGEVVGMFPRNGAPIGFDVAHGVFASEKQPYRRIELRKLPGGGLLEEMKGHDTGPLESLCFARKGDLLVSSDGAEIRLWDTSLGSLQATLKGGRVVPVSSFRMDALVAEVADGVLAIYGLPKGQHLVTLYFFPDAFVAVTPEGFFTGDGQFTQYLHVVSGLTSYGVDQFFDVFYRPDLVEKKLRGEDVGRYVQGLTIAEAFKQPPPLVSIVSPASDLETALPDLPLKVKVEDSGGGIGDIRVYHNGKLVESMGVYRLARPEGPESEPQGSTPVSAPSAVRLRRVIDSTEPAASQVRLIDFTPLKGSVGRDYNIRLVEGENAISVAAFNGANTVMSPLRTVRILARIPAQAPRLFVLAVGNSHFADKQQTLELPSKDARDLATELERTAKPIYAAVTTRVIVDATKATIMEEVTSLAKQVRPEDVFVLYMASHGFTSDDVHYVLTSDFDGDLRRERNWVSSVELMEFSKRILALRQVLILDTCYAGGADPIVAGLYDARISVLARAMGMHVFAGAKTFQEAQDNFEGNGLFTHFLLAGLRGQADANANREVTVKEMTPYLLRAVRQASKARQEPIIRNFGEDLAISAIR